LKPFVVASEEGAVQRIAIMMTMVFTLLINSLFAVRLCKAFDISPRVKRVFANLSIPWLNQGWSILRLTIMRVLAVDASLRNTGVAIVDAMVEPRLVDFKVKDNARARR